MFPNVPRVELFARKARPGWDAWGNEVEAPVDATSASAEAIEALGRGQDHHRGHHRDDDGCDDGGEPHG